MERKTNRIIVDASIETDGIIITVDSKPFRVVYPHNIWSHTSQNIKEIIRDNLAFGSTIYLPVLLDKEAVRYGTAHPLFENMLLLQHLYDMRDCEMTDSVKALTYLRPMYNVEYSFKGYDVVLPNPGAIPRFGKRKKALIPFSFGKESLLTYALCKELEIEPVLMMSQEPTQIFEEKHKLPMFRRFLKETNTAGYYIINEPGLFRHGVAFDAKNGTELGWGGQTTLLSLTALPFILEHETQYLLFGSEHSNNDWEMKDGWKVYCSYDQMSLTTPQQRSMMRMLTGDQCKVYSMLEPLEEFHAFYILHHRYPQESRNQFSCSAFKPLVKGSQWCHACDKCDRNYVFALAAGTDPAVMGFSKNLLADPSRYQYYFDEKNEYDRDLDFAFHVLVRKELSSPHITRFKKEIMPKIEPWEWYASFFSQPKENGNMPPECKDSLYSLFKQELTAMRKAVAI